MSNVVLIAPSEICEAVSGHTLLKCKLVTIQDGFKGLVGLIKLGLKNTPVAGVYVHESTGRVDLPMFVEVIRGLEVGLGRSASQIIVGLSASAEFASVDDVSCHRIIDGTPPYELTVEIVRQINSISDATSENS